MRRQVTGTGSGKERPVRKSDACHVRKEWKVVVEVAQKVGDSSSHSDGPQTGSRSHGDAVVRRGGQS